MKKLLALTSALILSVSCFTGCGKKNGSDSKKTVSELSKTASKFVTAVDSSFTDLEENGISLPSYSFICSDGTNYYTGNGSFFDDEANIDDLKNGIKGYFDDCDDYSWIAYSVTGKTVAFYCAEDFDSTVIGTYGNEILDVKGKSLNDIKKEAREKFTFNITIDDFISEFNENVPGMIRQKNARIEKVSDGEILYYPFDSDSHFTVKYSELDGYISRMSVSVNNSLSEFDEDGQNALLCLMTAPSTVLIDDLEKYDLKTGSDAMFDLADDFMESGYFIKYGIEYVKTDGALYGKSETYISFSPIGFKSEN